MTVMVLLISSKRPYPPWKTRLLCRRHLDTVARAVVTRFFPGSSAYCFQVVNKEINIFSEKNETLDHFSLSNYKIALLVKAWMKETGMKFSHIHSNKKEGGGES